MFWQFCDKERISQTSGHFLKMAILIWGAFAILSVVMMAPQMKSEETMRLKIRSLSPGNLRSVRIKGQGVPNVLVNDEESICQFCLLTSSAELFYPSHELSLEEFQITLTFQDLISWTFDARIPERHTDAISLLFKGTFAWCEIIIPRGHPWLKSALSKANRPLNPIEKSL
ncbi:MAG: hypothetical protein JW828_02495 [Sedimentisphaerales bacterium]|nr:hypothetical protein [Sedimentisphaerales bacterium]